METKQMYTKAELELLSDCREAYVFYIDACNYMQIKFMHLDIDLHKDFEMETDALIEARLKYQDTFVIFARTLYEFESFLEGLKASQIYM